MYAYIDAVLIIFVLFFLVGNYLRGAMEPSQQPMEDVEQSWLERFLNLFR
jgi:hypothetical protein